MAQIRYEWRGHDANGDVVSLVVEDATSDAFLHKVDVLAREGRFLHLLPKKEDD